MVKVNHIRHKKSDVADKAPKATDIANGEIAVNYAKDTERLYIKNKGGKIIPLSSDRIKMDSVINTVLMDRTMGKGCDASNPTLANVYGSKEALNKVLKHYKMGLFKDGALVKECAPCRITKAVDGSDINIDGTQGDIMLYTDTPIYRDRCNVSGVTVPNSTATTHNMIGLGLMPHQVGGKEAKKMNPFAFTPGYVQFDGKQYLSCYNTTYSGSSIGSNYITPLFTTNFIGADGAQGGYPAIFESPIMNMKRSRAKGPKYQGIFYEFYEMWLIAMYLELGSLYFTGIDSFGRGCCDWETERNLLNDSNWVSGGISGVCVKDEGGVGVDGYSSLNDEVYKIGKEERYGNAPLKGLLGLNYCNFEEALESQRFVDALVKSNLTSKVDGTTVLEYDDNNKGYIKVSDGVDVASGSGMTVDKKYYIIRNVPNCQGIGDGVMTYVLNVFVKTSFNDYVYHGDVNVGGKTVIFKFSYPTYRGLELLSGAGTQIEGINYIMYEDKGVYKGSIWYAKDYTDIKYDPTNFTDTDYKVSIGTPDEEIPYIKGFVKAGEYTSGDGWVKNTNYDVSLYCATECSEKGNESHYECGHVSKGGGYYVDGYKEPRALIVGEPAYGYYTGRSYNFNKNINMLNYPFQSGGFSIGNPSL